LQRRGLFRTEYSGSSLRAHLGLIADERHQNLAHGLNAGGAPSATSSPRNCSHEL
jgi:hypothetical protein